MIGRRWLAAALVGGLLFSQSAVNAQATVADFAPEECVVGDVRGTASPSRSWHLERLRLEEVHHIATGRGIKVAVIDTGAAINGSLYLRDGDRSRFTHFDMLQGLKTYGNENVTEFDCYHGTIVLSLLAAGRKSDGRVVDDRVDFYGVAPEAEVIVYRTLMKSYPEENDPPEQLPPVTEAIRDAVRRGVNIINISQVTNQTPPGFNEFKMAIQEAVASGVVVVAAAGNAGQYEGQESYPAAFDGVISVGASDMNDAPSKVSKLGGKVDIGAPGEGLVALGPSRLDGARGVESQVYESGQNGSSFAAPIVSGVIALMLDKQNRDIENGFLKPGDYLTPEEIKTRIVLTADPPPRSRTDPSIGAGIINPVRLLSGDRGAVGSGPGARAAQPPQNAPLGRTVDQVPIVVGISMGVVAVMLSVAGIVLAIAVPAAKRVNQARTGRR